MRQSNCNHRLHVLFVNCKLILDIEEKSHPICIYEECQIRFDGNKKGSNQIPPQPDPSSDEDNDAWSPPHQKAANDFSSPIPHNPRELIITSKTVSPNNEPPINSPTSQSLTAKKLILSPLNQIVNSAKTPFTP